MPYFMHMLGCAITLIGLVLMVWLGFWVLLLMAMLSAGYWMWIWLMRKGIVNPTPGVPFEGETLEAESDAPTITIIDAEFEQVPPPAPPDTQEK